MCYFGSVYEDFLEVQCAWIYADVLPRGYALKSMQMGPRLGPLRRESDGGNSLFDVYSELFTS